tara:strand:+ start:1403 stop:3019 length:1617 start_codon:yes stop_codon:yes gene_type:complete
MLDKETNNALTDKWSPILEGINDAHTRECTAVLLENQARHVLAEQAKSGMLEESTTVGQLGTFQKFAFPLVRRVFPELIANKIVGVQPMQGPVSQVFYLGFDRSATANGVSRTQGVYGKYLNTYRGLTPGPLAPSGLGLPTDTNTIGWDSSGNQTFSGSLGLGAGPVAGRAHTTGGVDEYDSSTVGNQIASFPGENLSQFNTSAGEVLSDVSIPEISFHIEQQAVIARTRKFRALWTIEAAQDLRAYHNLDLERELTDLLGKEVALEIDREILEDLRQIAYDVGGTQGGFNRAALDLANGNNFPADHDWTPASFTYDQGTHMKSASDTEPPDGGTSKSTFGAGTNQNVYFVDFASSALNLSPRHVGEVYSNLLAAVNFAAQDIYKTTYRGAGNYIITSPLVAAMLQSAAKLEGGLDSGEAGTLGAQILYKGKWAGMYDVYVDPLWPEDEILVGYKGSSPMEGGYVYAPYIPIQMLPTIVNPDDFQPRKGLITRYGKAVITPASRWYRIIRLVGANTNFLTQPFQKISNTYNTAVPSLN